MKECKIEGTVMSVKTVIQDAKDYSGTTWLTIQTKDGVSYKIWRYDLVKEIISGGNVFYSAYGEVPKIGGNYDFIIANTNHRVLTPGMKVHSPKYWDEEYQYCIAGAFFASVFNMYQSIAISGIFIIISLVIYIFVNPFSKNQNTKNSFPPLLKTPLSRSFLGMQCRKSLQKYRTDFLFESRWLYTKIFLKKFYEIV